MQQLENLLRMRQTSIDTWRFPSFPRTPEEITKCSWLLYTFEYLFLIFIIFFAWHKVKCTLRILCIEYLVWTAIEYYNLDKNKKKFDTLNLLYLQLFLPMVASLTASLVNRKTSTNLSSNIKSHDFNRTNIYSIQIRLFQNVFNWIFFKLLLSIDMIIKLCKCRLLLRLANAK